ncbi:MAG: glycosyltransferase [Anaerolineae bacterium]|nr:glycosyltransferase [Anaerolineae bacterium]
MTTEPASLPTVSVMICVYNGADHVMNAVNSILAQSFTDFELVVVDDGSTDETAVLIQSCSDPRVKLFRKPHQGIPLTRNYALACAQADLLAVLDADDTAHPTRLQQQVDYMAKHPEIVLVGTSYIQVDHFRNTTKVVVPPLHDAAIRQAMVRGNPFCHSTIMMRRAAIDKAGGYSPAFPFGEDYELWSRLAQQGQLANLDEALVTRHYHARSVSNNFRDEFYRFKLFARTNHYAIQRLGAPKTAYFYTARAIAMFLVLDLYAALKAWRYKQTAVSSS